VLALAAGVAERGDGRRGIGQQPFAKGRVDPGPRHHARAVARADAGLVGVDQRVERGGVDVALLREHGFERAHAQVHLAEFAVVVAVIAIMGMPVAVRGVVMTGHGRC
jgi:hypothetical protein